MKVIAACSYKGGTGKSTTMMMLANAIAARSQSAFLVDCDMQEAFTSMQTLSERKDASDWYDGFTVGRHRFDVTSPLELQDILEDADDSGRFDYALIDLPRIENAFSAEVLRYAEMTVVPFKPGYLELKELHKVMEVLTDLQEKETMGAARVIPMNIDERKLTVPDKRYLQEASERYRHYSKNIPTRSVLGDIVAKGILPIMLDRIKPSASGLGEWSEVRRIEEALDICLWFLSETDQYIQELSE